MINFPVTVVDNFFDNPDKIVEYALSCEYVKAEDGRWPGKRTAPLHVINPEIFNLSADKLISLFYADNLNPTWSAATYFQLVDNNYNGGWIHRDTDYIITGIVYLNKNENIKSGTSIYRPKKDKFYAKLIHNEEKIKNYTDIQYDSEKHRIENNLQFEETINISNVYNRLICFDSHLLHAAQNFSENLDPRLTLIMFIKNISNWDTPIKRLRSIG
jgi:hypothetical protein